MVCVIAREDADPVTTICIHSGRFKRCTFTCNVIDSKFEFITEMTARAIYARRICVHTGHVIKEFLVQWKTAWSGKQICD